MVTMISESQKHIVNMRTNFCGISLACKISCLIALLIHPAIVRADSDAGRIAVRSGVFEQLMLAVNQSGQIEGYYHEVQGDEVAKKCTFYFKGLIDNGTAEVSTWSTQIFPGSLTFNGNEVSLKIENGREHSGCGLVLLPEIATGMVLDRTQEASWTSLKVVRSERAYFYRETTESSKLKSYLIKGDVIGVLSRQGEWLQAEFPRPGKNAVSGWIKLSDVADFAPPAK